MKKLFAWVYQHTNARRKHSHRCRCCWKVIQPGEPVLVLRLDAHKTWMLHNSCEEAKHTETTNWRDAFEMWAGVREIA